MYETFASFVKHFAVGHTKIHFVSRSDYYKTLISGMRVPWCLIGRGKLNW